MPSQKSGMIEIAHQKLEEPIQVCSFWLRDHCRCSNCYSDTLQRRGNITSVPLDVEAIELNTENDVIRVRCKYFKGKFHVIFTVLK